MHFQSFFYISNKNKITDTNKNVKFSYNFLTIQDDIKIQNGSSI